MMLKPDAQSGWEMTMKLTLIQNEATPVELVNTDEIKVWCEGSKKRWNQWAWRFRSPCGPSHGLRQTVKR